MSVAVDQQFAQQVVELIQVGEHEVTRQPFLPPNIVVLVHGNNGAPSDFDAVEAALLRKFGRSQVLVIKSAMNHTQTSMGVEVGGMKLAQEVYDEVFKYELHPDVDTHKFSMISHSLGGLYSRFAIVQLVDSLSPLNIEYVSFATICTPHLGSRRPRGDSKLKNVWRMGVHTVLASGTIYGQTGLDLLVECKKSVVDGEPDDTPVTPPLLESMCSPDLPFFHALKQFRYGTLVAMTDGDVVVPYASASIRNFNPYPSNFLTDRFADWRWHVHHSGFTSGPDAADRSERHAEFLKKLDARVDKTVEIEHFDVGLDVTTSPRYPSIEGYDADNKQEVEFSYSMISSLQQAVPWRRIDVTVEPLGVKGKLRLHDWPINKMQPPGCRANEFIDLLCDMVGHDHEMDTLPESSSSESDDRTSTADEGAGDEGPRGSFIGNGITGINRMFERFQKRAESRSSEDGRLSPSQSSADSSGANEEPRNSFIGAGMSRLMGNFKKQGSFTTTNSPGASLSAQPSPKASPTDGESNELKDSPGAGGFKNRLLERFQKKVVVTVTTPVNQLQSTTTESVTSTSSSVESTPHASP